MVDRLVSVDSGTNRLPAAVRAQLADEMSDSSTEVGAVLSTTFAPFYRGGPLRAIAVGDSTVQGGAQDIFNVQYGIGNSYTVPSFPSVGNERAGAQSWFTWACLLSRGRLINIHNAGVGSDNTTGTLARFDAEVVALQPDVVFIQGGIRNDLGVANVPYATGRANIDAMIRKTVAAGALPVLVTAYPDNDAAIAARLRVHNAWLRQGAAGRDANYPGMRGLLIVDPYTAVVDPASSVGAWRAGWADANGTHAVTSAALAAGQKVLADLAGSLLGATGQPGAAAIGYLATDAVTGGLNLHPNPLFLNDSNSDGIPDGVIGAFTPGTGGGNSIVTDAEVIGKAWRILLGAGGSTQQQVQIPVDGTAVQVGDRMKWAGLVKVDGSAGALNAYLNFDFVGAGNSQAAYPFPIGATGAVMPSWGYFECDMIVPAGATICRTQVRSLSGYGEIKLAQQAVLNMTHGLG